MQAIATAVVLLATVAVFYLLGDRGFFVLICVVVSLALFEFVDALTQAGHLPSIPFTIACGLAMLVVAFFELPAYLAVVLAVAAFGGLIRALLPGRDESAMSDVAWMLLGLSWITGGGAAAVSILVIAPSGLEILIAFVLVAAIDDIGAYFAGTTFGRTKLAPSISPGKSWEGVIAGVTASLVAGGVAGFLLADLSVFDGLAIGAICGALAPVGDLVESLFKREIGIKDSGRLLPGHGGFLDRLDAIIFCAPAVFLYLRFVVF
jgi:phosphatidate cytidylyltransferase